MNEQPDKPKRRWLRFSLRTLFVLLTVACLLIGWQTNKARQQRKAVAWVEKMGGYVTYQYEFDYMLDNGFRSDDAEPPVSAWLRDLVGIDFFSELRGVYLSGTQADNVEQLAKLTNLKYLNLDFTQVRGVAPLAKLTHLQSLSISGTHVNDVAPLAPLIDLEFLDLSGTHVSDVAPLAKLTNLEHLKLSLTQVRDLTPLAKLTRLSSLDLTASSVSEEGIQQLRQALPNLIIQTSWGDSLIISP